MKLADYLKETEQTITDFAARTGVPRSTITRLAAGQGTCSIQHAATIIEATGRIVTLADLNPAENARGAR